MIVIIKFFIHSSLHASNITDDASPVNSKSIQNQPKTIQATTTTTRDVTLNKDDAIHFEPIISGKLTNRNYFDNAKKLNLFFENEDSGRKMNENKTSAGKINEKDKKERPAISERSSLSK